VPGEGQAPRGAWSEALRALVAGADYELIPLRSLEEQVAGLPASVPVTVTASVKLGLDRTVAWSVRLAERGHRVVPHLPARQLEGPGELADRVAQLAEAGIRDIYVVGGDATEPRGRFREALDVLRALGELGHRFESVGVACYPEGHPAIPEERLWEALLAKQELATYMCSQLCYDATALAAWLRDARARGVWLPLHLSVAGPLGLLKLSELSLRIGVGESVKYLAKQRGLVGALLRGRRYAPEALLEELGEGLVDPEFGIEALHLITFNQVHETLDWQRTLLGSSGNEDRHRRGG
jgi:methylenetetrahydrofolate reductase (NADPH)